MAIGVPAPLLLARSRAPRTAGARRRTRSLRRVVDASSSTTLDRRRRRRRGRRRPRARGRARARRAEDAVTLDDCGARPCGCQSSDDAYCSDSRRRIARVREAWTRPARSARSAQSASRVLRAHGADARRRGAGVGGQRPRHLRLRRDTSARVARRRAASWEATASAALLDSLRRLPRRVEDVRATTLRRRGPPPPRRRWRHFGRDRHPRAGFDSLINGARTRRRTVRDRRQHQNARGAVALHSCRLA